MLLYANYSIYTKKNQISVDFNNSLFNDRMLWAILVTTSFTFCWSGEVIIERESSYNPKTHLSFDNIVVDDNKCPKVISLLLK